jgi:hypothetical protein
MTTQTEGEHEVGGQSPPFYCPECGHKHRADLTMLAEHPGSHAKVKCHRCGLVIQLSVDAEGMPVVERADGGLAGLEKEAVSAAPPRSAPPPSPNPEPAAARSGGGGFVTTVLVAAIVGGAVAHFVPRPEKKAEETATPDTGMEDRLASLDLRLEELAREVKSAAQAPSADPGALAQANARFAEIEARLTALKAEAKAVGDGARSELETRGAALQKKLDEGLKSLNGRIESNYQALKALEKRLPAEK